MIIMIVIKIVKTMQVPNLFKLRLHRLLWVFYNIDISSITIPLKCNTCNNTFLWTLQTHTIKQLYIFKKKTINLTIYNMLFF